MVSFYILGIITLISSVMVITQRNPMHSALWLLVTFFGLAGIYLLMSAEFVAAVQIIIYAGGILVLYIFVIMLVDLSKEAALRAAFHRPAQVGFALLFAVIIMAVVLSVSSSGIEPFAVNGNNMAAAEAPVDTTRAFAERLFLTYLYPFEIASVLLLVAMIGSVILARRGMIAPNSAKEKEAR